MTKYQGIFPVLYTFFDRQGRIDRGLMKEQVEYCIRQGAHGITVLGLVSEVHKMDVNERLYLVELVGQLIESRVPYLVTVAEPSVQGQIEFNRAAANSGADAVLLQPPPIKGLTEAEVIQFMEVVAVECPIDVGIQNNPVNLDVSLSVNGLTTLIRQNPNVRILKAEGTGTDIAQVITQIDPEVSILGGHGGIEFMSLLRSGGHGLIPAPDFLIPQVELFKLWQKGTPQAIVTANHIHNEILPAIVFMSRSVPNMLCYGKRLLASQLGLPEPIDRQPAKAPTAFGLAELKLLQQQIADSLEAANPGESVV